MSDIVRILICALPSIVAFLCMVTVLSKWRQRSQSQRTVGIMLLIVFVGSLGFFIFRSPSLHRAHRLDWFLSSVMTFAPAVYYLFICRLTGTGRRVLLKAFLLPSVLSFISLVLYMVIGDKGSGDYTEQVRLVWPVTVASLPVTWKVTYIFQFYVLRVAMLYQIVAFVVATNGRIARFHTELKDYFADAETELFRSGTALGISGVVFLASLAMMNLGPYYIFGADIHFVIIAVSLLSIGMIYLTVYALHQPITSEVLASLSEDTKNMGKAAKNRSSLKERLADAIEDEFYTNPDISIMDMAEKIGTNREYLADIIHVLYGMSFADFVNDLRVKKAIREMRGIPLNSPLTRVAKMCGYTTYSQFAHNFEKFAHLTPSEWMKRYR